jgi:hypothetical protein
MAGGLALAVPAIAKAETKNYQVCSGASFSTCAAVSVSVDGHWVTVTVQNLTGPNAGKTSYSKYWTWTNNWQSWVNNAVNQVNANGQVKITPCGPGTSLASCTTTTSPPSTTVTPEPVTMTLLATGLMGMGGVGFVRRRKKPIAAV